MKVKVSQSSLTLCNPLDYSPWNSPGQNTGMGSLSLPNPGIEPRSPTLWADSLPAEPQGKSKNTGVGSLSLLQRIFLTQELNHPLLHCRWILYQLSHKVSPRILEWVAYPFFRGSSRPRNRTRVSCIAGGFLTNWAMKETGEARAVSYLKVLTCVFCPSPLEF